jgi:predicted metal-dependent HD superfamily phosphohydrolase
MNAMAEMAEEEAAGAGDGAEGGSATGGGSTGGASASGRTAGGATAGGQPAGGATGAAARHPAYAALTERWAATVTAARGTDPGNPGTTAPTQTPAPGTPDPQTPQTPDPEAWKTPALPYAENLLARWAEPQRRYHTVDHLVAVLDRVDVLEEYADDPAVVRLAAWFHDAVYLPDRSTNEERSARLAERALPELGVDASRTAEVARLVRLTVTHDPRPQDADGAVLCDADLGILAAPPEAYAAYTAAVREEYAFVPPDAFRAGRAAVLRQLLDLPRLFRTPYGPREWEAPARDNLRAELTRLA